MVPSYGSKLWFKPGSAFQWSWLHLLIHCHTSLSLLSLALDSVGHWNHRSLSIVPLLCSCRHTRCRGFRLGNRRPNLPMWSPSTPDANRGVIAYVNFFVTIRGRLSRSMAVILFPRACIIRRIRMYNASRIKPMLAFSVHLRQRKRMKDEDQLTVLDRERIGMI